MTATSGHRLAAGVGVVSVALIEVAMAVSLAALILRDAPIDSLPRLMGALLIGSAIGVVIVGLRSSMPGTISTVQDTPVVVIAAVAGPMLAGVAAEQRFATVLALVAITGVATGLVMLVLGLSRMGDVVRYLPAPVMSGFRLGTGWLLLVGGLEVAAGESLTLDTFDGVAGWSLLLAALVALVVAVTGELGTSARVLSATLLGSVVAFFAVGATVDSVDGLEDGGWLLGPLSSDPSWRPLASDLDDVDWGALADQWAAILVVAFISVVGMLLNTGAIEAELDRDADIDHDLRVTGVANTVIGVAGSSPIYVMFSGTLLANRLGIRDRRATVALGALIFLALVLGATTAGYTPRFVCGGLLAGLGLGLGSNWLSEQRARSIADAALALVVAVGIAAVGVLEGVALGVVLAAVIFVRRYSVIDPARRVRRGRQVRSRTDRSPLETAHLDAHRDAMVVIELEGFLFFGSVVQIRQRVRDELGGATTDLLVDFTAVTGIDLSAEIQLGQVLERVRQTGVRVWLSGAAAAPMAASGSTVFDDLDRAVEAIEDAQLAAASLAVDAGGGSDLAALLVELPIRSLADGEHLFQPGEASDGFVLVVSGAIGVWLDRDGEAPVRLRRVGPGALLGELGYATGAPRSARATADGAAEVRVVTEDALAERGDAFTATLHRLVLAQVADRLAITNEIVRNLSR